MKEAKRIESLNKLQSDIIKQGGVDFTVLMESWTEYEYEPGWGSSQRNDGFRFYKNSSEREQYIKESYEKQKEYDSQNSDSGYSCYWRADNNAKLVKVPQELWYNVQLHNAISYHYVEIKDHIVIKYGN